MYSENIIFTWWYDILKGFLRMIRYGYLGLFLVWHFERQQSGVIGYTTSTHCLSGVADGWPDETQDEDCNESEMRIFISLVSDWTRRKIQCNIPTILKSITNKKSHMIFILLQNLGDSIMKKKENPKNSNTYL